MIKKKTAVLSLDISVIDGIKELAEDDDRTLSAMANLLLKKAVKDRFKSLNLANLTKI